MEMHRMFRGFADRSEGGHRLAEALERYRGDADAMVIALPRGGVVTGEAIAEDLDLPLDVLVVRKLGAPGREELAMGAIGPAGVRVLNEDVVRTMGISAAEIEAETRRARIELERRERLYRGSRPPIDFAGKTVILVDDGLATGSTMAAAIAVIRRREPARIVLAIPVAPMDTLEGFRFAVDELVYLETPEPFMAVGYWYIDFSQVSDEEVIAILERSRARAAAPVAVIG